MSQRTLQWMENAFYHKVRNAAHVIYTEGLRAGPPLVILPLVQHPAAVPVGFRGALLRVRMFRRETLYNFMKETLKNRFVFVDPPEPDEQWGCDNDEWACGALFPQRTAPEPVENREWYPPASENCQPIPGEMLGEGIIPPKRIRLSADGTPARGPGAPAYTCRVPTGRAQRCWKCVIAEPVDGDATIRFDRYVKFRGLSGGNTTYRLLSGNHCGTDEMLYAGLLGFLMLLIHGSLIALYH